MLQIVTLAMPRAVRTKEVTMRCPKYVLMHQVLQEEVEAKAEKGDTKREADWKTTSQERAKRDAKEEDGDPSYSVGRKD